MAGAARPELPRVDEANECIWWGARRVDLAPKAFRVLRRLLQQPNQIVAKRALLDAAWPDTHVSEGVLTLAINQLRDAFGDDSRQARFIETVHRRGYRWIGSIPAADSAARASTPGSSLFVGRNAALAHLEQALAQASSGARQLVFVTGEPGIGKTALVDEFLRTSSAAPVSLAFGQCVDGFGTSDPYMPLLEALERLDRHAPSGEIRSLLRRLAPTWLLQLPRLIAAGEHDDLRRSLGGASGERMVRELLSFLEELAAERTLVLVIEDLHWSDHATVGALAALATRREPARLLVIASYRPADAIARQHPVTTLKHELSAKRQCSAIGLDGLTSEDVDAYLAGRFPQHRLPFELAGRLQEQTAGNPLFVLNACDDFVQRGWLHEHDGAWQCRVDLATLAAAVPDGTREMIGFRLRQLASSDLELLEAATVVGTSFATQALAAAVGRGPAEIEVECADLAHAAQFIGAGQPTTWPDGSSGMRHAFRHALYQQVLYGRVTPARRQLLHRRVAERLEKGFAPEAATIAPQLARHFECGADAQRAVHYRQIAARQAMERSAYDQAIEHLQAALADLAAVSAGAERDACELRISCALLQPLFARLSTSSAELVQVVERIQSLSGRGETTPELLVSLAMLTGHHSMSGDMRAARSVSEHMLARAEAVSWGGVMATMARGVLGYCQVMQGEIAAGVQNLEASMDIPDMTPALPLDPGIITTKDAAFGHCLLGRVSRGVDLLRMALRRAEASRHPPTLVHTVLGGVRIGVVLRDDELLERCAAQIASLPKEMQAQWEAWADVSRSFIAAKRGDAGAAEQILRGGETLLGAGTPFYQSLHTLIATTALIACGRHDDANAHLTAALALISESGERWCEAELYRLRAEILLAQRAQPRRASKKRQDLGANIEADLRRALDVARAQGAKWWELRAAVSLARLLRDRERSSEARDQLRHVYGESEAILDLPDLRDAREVLRSS